ncbi:hypothetical protein FHK99_19260, partial [Cylindrospermopsis raciborskii CS-506_B]|nr:hypothetical protein [Cylindrospermopsis raciborskii CS-506_B]
HQDVKLVLRTRLGDIPVKIEQAVDKISVLSILDELLKVAIKVDCLVLAPVLWTINRKVPV